MIKMLSKIAALQVSGGVTSGNNLWEMTLDVANKKKNEYGYTDMSLDKKIYANCIYNCTHGQNCETGGFLLGFISTDCVCRAISDNKKNVAVWSECITKVTGQ
jgi:hypothetical protein